MWSLRSASCISGLPDGEGAVCVPGRGGGGRWGVRGLGGAALSSAVTADPESPTTPECDRFTVQIFGNTI